MRMRDLLSKVHNVLHLFIEIVKIQIKWLIRCFEKGLNDLKVSSPEVVVLMSS